MPVIDLGPSFRNAQRTIGEAGRYVRSGAYRRAGVSQSQTGTASNGALNPINNPFLNPGTTNPTLPNPGQILLPLLLQFFSLLLNLLQSGFSQGGQTRGTSSDPFFASAARQGFSGQTLVQSSQFQDNIAIPVQQNSL